MRLVALVALVGCYDPRPPEGAPCGTVEPKCPAGQTCSLIDDRCYEDPPGGMLDAPKPTDDAPPNATCTSKRLLTGGMSPTAQGWTIERVGSGSITAASGVTTLSTTNNGRQLLVLRDAVPTSGAWTLQVIAEVVTSGGYTPNHAAIAIMSSFHDPVGDDNDRKRMLALDEDAVAWGEGATTIGVTTKAQVVYRLERTSTNSLKATVIPPNGLASITAAGFTSNGSIAIGDQTTEPGLDSTFHLYVVDLVCP